MLYPILECLSMALSFTFGARYPKLMCQRFCSAGMTGTCAGMWKRFHLVYGVLRQLAAYVMQTHLPSIYPTCYASSRAICYGKSRQMLTGADLQKTAVAYKTHVQLILAMLPETSRSLTFRCTCICPLRVALVLACFTRQTILVYVYQNICLDRPSDTYPNQA
jgi:hypothetical protein